MHDLLVSRSQRYGHDRLYVKTSAGANVGWIDLLTWRVELDQPARGQEFHAAVAAFTAANSIPIPALVARELAMSRRKPRRGSHQSRAPPPATISM